MCVNPHILLTHDFSDVSVDVRVKATTYSLSPGLIMAQELMLRVKRGPRFKMQGFIVMCTLATVDMAMKNLKDTCHAFPVITHPLVCYEGFYACKRSAESKPSKYTL